MSNTVKKKKWSHKMPIISNDAPPSQDAPRKATSPTSEAAGQNPAAQHSPRTQPSAEMVRRFEHAFEECDEEGSATHTPSKPYKEDKGDTAHSSGAGPCSGMSMGQNADFTSAGQTGNARTTQDGAQRSSEQRASSRSSEEEQQKGLEASEERRVERHPLGMTHPLDGLFPAPAATQPLTTVTAQEMAQIPDHAWQLLAERILVAEPSQGGTSEVRILVNQNILPDTEISLTRHADGSLHAVLLTDDAAAFQTLVARRDDLRQRLERLGADNVFVDVSTRGGNDAGDMRQRSRGLVQPVPGMEE